MLQFGFLLFYSPEVSRAPLGALLSVICSSCLQAFHLQCSHRNNDDPVLSLSLSYSQFSSVLIIVPQLQELLRHQDGWGWERETETERGRRKEKIKKKRARRKESLQETEGRDLISKEGQEKGWQNIRMDGQTLSQIEIERQRKTEKVKAQRLHWFLPDGEHI